MSAISPHQEEHRLISTLGMSSFQLAKQHTKQTLDKPQRVPERGQFPLSEHGDVWGGVRCTEKGMNKSGIHWSLHCHDGAKRRDRAVTERKMMTTRASRHNVILEQGISVG